MLSLPFFFFPDDVSDFAISVFGLLFLVWVFFSLIFNIAHLTAVLKYRPKYRACSLSAYFKIKHIRKKHQIYELLTLGNI